jgi:hypothetical protein
VPYVSFSEWNGGHILGNPLHDKLIAASERERRVKRRFPIEQDVLYKMLYGQRIAETGIGKTMNISSGGIWFSTETVLSSGMPIELSLSWPVLLNDSCPIKLMIYGCVIRSSRRGTAAIIERYDFRTQARSPQKESGIYLGMEYKDSLLALIQASARKT